MLKESHSSSERIRATNHSNPCPLCGNTSGHDKFSGEGVLCHNGLDGAYHGNGWRFTRNTKDDQWGIYYPSGQEYDPEKARALQEQREQRERKQLQQALPVAERDKYYRQLAATLPKNRADADLLNRGLSLEQIEKYHFFDIRGDQSVPQNIPDNFPGVREDWKFSNGRKVFSYAVEENKGHWKDTEGYAVPCYTLDGEISGYQIRNTQGEGERYKWAGTKTTSCKLPIGEMPLTVFTPNPESKDLWFCDSILKPLIASEKHNINIIGIPNGNYKACAQQVKEVNSRVEPTRIIRAVDAGDIFKEGVIKSIKKEHPFLASFGIEVVYAWWEQRIKKVDPDIDELLNLDKVQFLSYQELLQLAKQEQWKKQKDTSEWLAWIRSKEFKATVNFNSRYLSDSIDLSTIPSNTIALIKSGLSTGKTKSLIDYLNTTNQGAVCIGYRNSLLFQFNEKSKFYHISERGSDEVNFADPNLRISLCIHSLRRIPVDAFDGKILILDEVKSVLNALLFDKNLKNRAEIIFHFREAIKRCDQVLCFDGNLSNKEVKYLSEICPEKQILTFKNSFKGSKAPIYLIDGYETDEKVKKNSNDLLIKQMLASKEQMAICSDNQVYLESVERLIKETTNLTTVRADSKTKDNPEIIKLTANPDEWLRENQPDVFLYSPYLESGIDIAIKDYFKAHYGFFFGVLGVDSIHQMLLRLRDIDAPKWLWVKSFVPTETLEKNPTTADLVAEFVRARLVKEVNFTFGQEPQLASKLQEICGDLSLMPETELAYSIEAAFNFEKSHLKKCVEHHLKEAGHEVEIVKYHELDAVLSKRLKELSKEVKVQNGDDIFNAKDDFIGKPEKTAITGTYAEKCAIAKAVLIERLLGIRESGVWGVNFIYEVTQANPNLISDIENYWMLVNSQGEKDLAKELTRIKYHKILTSSKAFLPWLWRPTYLNIKALKSIGLIEFIETYKNGGCYHKDNEDVKRIHRLAKTKEKDLKLSVDNDPVKFVNKVLKRLGLKAKSAGRQSTGDRLPLHQIDTHWLEGEIFTAIYDAVDRRLTTRIEKNSTLDWTIPKPKPQETEIVYNAKNDLFKTLESLQDNTSSRQDDLSDLLYNNKNHPDGFSNSFHATTNQDLDSPESLLEYQLINAKEGQDVINAVETAYHQFKERLMDVLDEIWEKIPIEQANFVNDWLWKAPIFFNDEAAA